MHGNTRYLIQAFLLAALLAVSPAMLYAELPPGDPIDDPNPEGEWVKDVPLTVRFGYSLVSDHIWRGYNLTEYTGEGRERPSHQFEFDLALDLKELAMSEADLGFVGARIWFQSYSGQMAQYRKAALATGSGGSSGDHLQQVDYTLYWQVDIEQTFEVELGLTYRTWPRLESMSLPANLPRYGHNDERTTEVYIQIKLDDSELFGRDTPLLSPSLLYALDIDETDEGSWIEIGVEHEFHLGQVGAFDEATPLRHVTITPSVTLGLDHRYLDSFGRFARRSHQKADRLGNMVYGLEFEYDLSRGLQMREESGRVVLGLFIKFSDALREDLLNDEFYGGVTLGYRW